MPGFNGMKVFALKVFLFFTPVLLIIIVMSYLIDPFKVFKDYTNYYKQGFVSLNRDMVCTRTYRKYRNTEKFNSFIFGSSRSLTYQLDDWKNHLSEDAKPFHYDASGEGIYGVCMKILYIDELGDTIKNALIIADRDLLSTVTNQKSHLLISSPEISKESKINFYTTFIRAELKVRFLMAYTDYSLFKKYRNYMSLLVFEIQYPSLYDSVNCNMIFGKEQEIALDSVNYIKKLIQEGVFYKRPKLITENYHITETEILQLKTIKTIFDKHHTNYKIIISPLYDQVPLDLNQLNLLYDVFGKNNVYNFSGKNEFTEPLTNFYEAQHYRSHVARKIMNIIYN